MNLNIEIIEKIKAIVEKDNPTENFEYRYDVNEVVAKELNVSRATVQRARQYTKALEEYPDLKKYSSVISVLNEYTRRKNLEKRKQYIKSVEHRFKNLIHGDALEIIPTLQDNSIDLLLTDPPYGMKWLSNHRIVKNINRLMQYDDENVFEMLDDLFRIVKPKLKSDAHIYIFNSWKTYHKLRPVIDKYYTVKNVLVWDKVNWTGGDIYNNYADRYELIIFAVNGKGRKLNWIRRPSNILSYVRPSNDPSRAYHPAEKPVGLLMKLIEYSTVEGEVVLDPFCGSGSTLIAAEKLKRQWIGVEIDREWYENALERLGQEAMVYAV